MHVQTGKFADCLRTGAAALAYSVTQSVVRFTALVLGLLIALGGAAHVHAAGYTANITTAYPQLAINVSAPQVVWANCNSGGQPSAYNKCDDGVTQIMPIGFTFNYAGTSYTKWSMSSNGAIFFETNAVGGTSTATASGSSTYTPNALPTANFGSTNQPALMPFWADLIKNASKNGVLANNDSSQPANASFYQYQVLTVSGAQVLVIQLKNVGYYSAPSNPVNMQIQIWATGQIVYAYGAMTAITSGNDGLTIGLQYPGGGCNNLANQLSTSLSNQSYLFAWSTTAAACSTIPTVNHYEIREDQAATLCAEPVTVLACSVATSPCPAASIINTQIINAAVTVTGTGSLGTPTISPVSFNIQPSAPTQTINLTWTSGSSGTATLGIQAAVSASGALVCTNAAGTAKYANCAMAVANTACIAPPHHYEVQGPANGSICANNTFTIKAWADASQTTAYTAGVATGTLTQTGNPASLPSLGAFTIPSGSSTVNITPITFPATGTTTFSTTATPALAGATTCKFGSSTSCALVASSATCVADFNCTETVANAAVAADSDPSTGNLYTKLAGTQFSFDVMARLSSGSVLSTYASDADKTVTVELVDSTTAAACASYPNITTPTATSQSLSFTKANQGTDQGRKTVSFTVPKAYTNVRCRATDNNGVKGCSIDSFAIRPPSAILATTPAMEAPPSASTANPITAGATFTLSATASAGTNYNPTLTLDTVTTPPLLTAQLTTNVTTQQSGGIAGTLTPASLVANATAVDATYSEVGYLYLAAGAYYDNATSAFTAVDVRATPLSSDCIVGSFSDVLSGGPTAGTGKYGCNIGTAPASFGRFIPDHFATAVTLNAGVPMSCPTGQTCPTTYNGLVYSGQPYTLTVQAMNGLATPTVTQNYMYLFAKAVTLGAFNAGTTANKPGGATPNPGGGALAITNIAAGSNAFTVATPAFGSGMLVVPVSPGVATIGLAETYTLPAALTAPRQIYIRATDAEGITSLLATAENSIEGGVLVAQGRINVPNLIGSEKLGLCVPATVQYYTGSSWTTSLTDSATSFNTNLCTTGVWNVATPPASTCTAPVGASVMSNATSMTNGTGLTLITSGTTPVGCPGPGAGATLNGIRRFRIASNNNTAGISNITIVNGPAYLPSTSGRMFFGGYKSPVIDIREVFR